MKLFLLYFRILFLIFAKTNSNILSCEEQSAEELEKKNQIEEQIELVNFEVKTEQKTEIKLFLLKATVATVALAIIGCLCHRLYKMFELPVVKKFKFKDSQQDWSGPHPISFLLLAPEDALGCKIALNNLIQEHGPFENRETLLKWLRKYKLSIKDKNNKKTIHGPFARTQDLEDFILTLTKE